MPSIPQLTASASAAEIANALRSDGACVVTGVLDAAQLGRLRAETDPLIARSGAGRDDFTGRQTRRTGALVARSPACREIVMQPLMLGAANAFLREFCHRIQLHLTQLISIGPGQPAQSLHRDRLAWGHWLPREIEPQFNTIWALTDFTAANGATCVVPGSNTWPSEDEPRPGQVVQADMPAGSVLCYSGSVIHGGGENRSNETRIGMNITYCLGWLRQEENQFLSCPPEVARELPQDLTDLLGYTMGSYALGYYSNPEQADGRPDTTPPEFALGRKPQGKTELSLGVG